MTYGVGKSGEYALCEIRVLCSQTMKVGWGSPGHPVKDRVGHSQTQKFLIRKSMQGRPAVHCTLLCSDRSNGVSPLFDFHLVPAKAPGGADSISVTPESVPSTQVPNSNRFLDHRSLYSGKIIPNSLLPFPVHIFSAVPFSSFPSSCFQSK